MPQAPSTRWCPTPEQLMILEEMYRSGVRTPTASQIQQITAHLSYYGRIEGKNVFYWFQNHKARDRQKLRRRLSRHHHLYFSCSHPHSLHRFEETFHPPALPPPPPPPPLPFHHQIPPHFLHQLPVNCSSSPLCHCFSGGGPQVAANQGLNLLCKLETGGREETPTRANNTEYGYEWMVNGDSAVPRCCRPLKTLDLFPTKSTGLKDEGSTSKSSSCSTSTNLSP